MDNKVNINYFLMDGIPSGRIKCTLFNWTGIVYRIPRTDLDICKERQDLVTQSGVYFLFGTDNQGEESVYVGQAGNRNNGGGILSRLNEHKRNEDEDYWTEAIICTTRDDCFGATEISWLENHFYNLAKEAKRYQVKNEQNPNRGKVTEEKESDLKLFAQYTQIIFGVLGYKLFEPIPSKPVNKIGAACEQDTQSERIIYHLSGGNYNATGEETDEGFVVFKDSIINPTTNDSCPNAAKRLREELIKAQKILNNKLLEDVICKSPHLAGGLISGSSISAPANWRATDGRTMKEIEKMVTNQENSN